MDKGLRVVRVAVSVARAGARASARGCRCSAGSVCHFYVLSFRMSYTCFMPGVFDCFVIQVPAYFVPAAFGGSTPHPSPPTLSPQRGEGELIGRRELGDTPKPPQGSTPAPRTKWGVGNSWDAMQPRGRGFHICAIHGPDRIIKAEAH